MSWTSLGCLCDKCKNHFMPKGADRMPYKVYHLCPRCKEDVRRQERRQEQWRRRNNS